MDVNPEKARFKTEHAGQTYYFCSQGCQQKFVAEPGKYTAARIQEHVLHPSAEGAIRILPSAAPVRPESKAPQHGRPAAAYTCPMHPEVRESGPGACPECGMALEPVSVPVPARKVEYVALGVPIAAGAFYPLFGLLLNPMIASAAMSFSSVSVISNALRLQKAAL
jgi:Cu+-exporting ATPase